MLTATLVRETTLLEHDTLGTVALSLVPNEYSGPCQVELHSMRQPTQPQSVGFTTRKEAMAAAKFAVGELGGYLQAIVKPCTHAEATYECWNEWAFQ